jgi:hypothetical protein
MPQRLSLEQILASRRRGQMIQQERDKVAAQILNYVWLYIFIYIYILSILQDIIDMLSTAHMKLQIAKQSFTKNSERSSFGQRPSKSSRQVPQVYTPGNSSNQVSKACLPSKSSKQVFQASAWVEDLLGRLA